MGLTALVEVHDEAETERALKIPNIQLIGINNRNLATFEVSLTTTERLRPMIPADITVVAESGIFTATDVERLEIANIDAILVGEALVTSEDIPAKVRELSGMESQSQRVLNSMTCFDSASTLQTMKPMTIIKICGIKILKDALAAIEAGADYLGFNFYPKSVRFIEKSACAEIASVLKREHPQIKLVGVFVNSSVEEIKGILQTCQLDLAQLHGDETPETFAATYPHAFRAFRGIPESNAGYERNEVPAMLIDAAVKGVYGGSGVTADWQPPPNSQRNIHSCSRADSPRKCRGRRSPVQPWGVDVASGVESATGEKDAGKMVQFVKEIKRLEIGTIVIGKSLITNYHLPTTKRNYDNPTTPQIRSLRRTIRPRNAHARADRVGACVCLGAQTTQPSTQNSTN